MRNIRHGRISVSLRSSLTTEDDDGDGAHFNRLKTWRTLCKSNENWGQRHHFLFHQTQTNKWREEEILAQHRTVN